jgi:hypothetical protein
MDIEQSNWNESDNSNSTAAPDGAPEGMAASGVNDVLRAMMGAIKRWLNRSNPKVTGGTSTAYTLSYSVAPTSLVDGMTHLVQFNAVNGANPTLNVNGLGAKPLTFYCGGSWSTGTNTMPPFLLGIDQVVQVTYNAATGTYRCVALPLVLRQTVSGVGFIDFTNIPTNVSNLQLIAQIVNATNGSSLLLRTYTSAGALSTGGTDYNYDYTAWTGTLTPVTTGNTGAAITLGSAIDNTGPVLLDAIAGNIQSGTVVQFNFGSHYSSSTQLAGLRGVGYRAANASISGLRLLPGSTTFNGSATLILS